jgi:hypothetical protein
MSSAESYLASQLERLMALPLETKSDLENWESERNNVERALHEKFRDFEPSHNFWHFMMDADIRLRDIEYRNYQHKLISQYISRLRGTSAI